MDVIFVDGQLSLFWQGIIVLPVFGVNLRFHAENVLAVSY